MQLLAEFMKGGVRTVAVYTVQDCSSEHVRLADEAVCIGDTLDSYNDWNRIISAAELFKVDAIHTGDGPLSTHERFTKICTDCGIRLVRLAEPGGPANGSQPFRSE